MLHKSSVLIVLLAVCLLAGCGTNSEGKKESAEVELTISAAASLTDALEEIKDDYEAKREHVKLSFNFGASGALQQQIEQGAPVDLFLAAAPKNMKALVDKGLVAEDKQRSLLRNELVVVTPAEGVVEVRDMAELASEQLGKIAVGIPESVPAGQYAKEALTSAKLWEVLKSKLVQGKDVRQVLHYVETGNTDAGFVYRTDALGSSKVKIAFAVDEAAYTPIQYPIGIVKASKHSEEAEAFYTYLQSKEALDIFIKYGFRT
ncbi:molybdate ABC transporter substrate-binding protein [Paenibacillus sp. GCM10023252]|uniref:molybdate ABC transporter substrate-binding protein n=1 Tax=Paenibacillus sp. GCM10023252 TaxID=3252649 RepID=UPI00360F83EF